jgi:hypothetical protein
MGKPDGQKEAEQECGIITTTITTAIVIVTDYW